MSIKLTLFQKEFEEQQNEQLLLLSKEKRQNKKLDILKLALLITIFAFIGVSLILFFFSYVLEKPLHNEYTLLVMVTVLGSTMTTIVGIIGGTSLK